MRGISNNSGFDFPYLLFKLRDLPVRLCNIGQIRKTVIGGGHVKSAVAKPAVMAVCKGLGWAPTSFDEADAGAVFLFLSSQLRPKLTPKLDIISLGFDPLHLDRKERFR